MRIAARLGFRFTRDIALSIKELSCSVLKLDKVSEILTFQIPGNMVFLSPWANFLFIL